MRARKCRHTRTGNSAIVRCVSRSIRVIGSSSRSRIGALAASNRSRTRALVEDVSSSGASVVGAPSARADALPRPRSRSLTRSP
ncbi:hypothetical protein GCM10017608_22500 [Agromyces luteolus]|nr:hypothetical protein GCM10017608_22500 [Agromyces luteolus]